MLATAAPHARLSAAAPARLPAASPAAQPRPTPTAPSTSSTRTSSAPASPPPRFPLPMPARKYMFGLRFLPGHCFLCGACLRKLAAADSDTDPNNDPEHADAEYVDGRPPGRTPCARGPACRDARTPVVTVRADLKTMVQSRVYDTHLAPSPYVAMARSCAADLRLAEMRWTFCRGAGGMTKRLRKGNLTPAKQGRSRWPHTVVATPAPAAPAAPAPVTDPAAAGPAPAWRRDHQRNDDAAAVVAIDPDSTAATRAGAITMQSMAVARAQVVLQTHQLYLDIRERMRALGYRRDEIDGEIARMRRASGVLGVP
ncbi:hypothetical protein GGF32_002571 [Allomyces javanicus]|nr:hypothetical protein GGF32_002571 [Allomyces javanicus]